MWSIASTRFVLYTARLRSCTDLYINNRLLEEAGLLLSWRLCARTEPFAEMRAVWVRKLALLHESCLNTEQSWTETKYNCRLEESKREKWREWESAVIAHSDWEKVEKGQTAGAGLMLFTLFYKLKKREWKRAHLMLQLEAWESLSSQEKHWTNLHIPHWKMGFIIYQDHLWEITLEKKITWK